MTAAETTEPTGPVQAPDPVQVEALSSESRATIADELGRRYPQQRGQIDQWYKQSPAEPPSLGQAFDNSALGLGNSKGVEFDVRPLLREGHDAGEVAEFTEGLAEGLASALPAPVAEAVGNEMIRTQLALENADPEAVTAHWAREREVIERVAGREGDDWNAIREHVQRAWLRMPQEFREELARSQGLNNAAVVLQLWRSGKLMAAREAMG